MALSKSDFNRAKRLVKKGESRASVDASGRKIPKNEGAGKLMDADSSSRFAWEPGDVEIVEPGDDEETPEEDKGEDESTEAKKAEDDAADETEAEGSEVAAAPTEKRTEVWIPFWKKDYTPDQRAELARQGKAIPIKDPDTDEIIDGRYPIANTADLANAISAFGRAKDPEEVKALIVRQAKALGATDQLPADWPGSTQKSASGGLRGLLTKLAPQDVTPELPYRVVKAAAADDPDARYTLGIAYPADRVDVHGEYTDADELEKAAWRFAKAGFNASGIQHKTGTGGAGQVVESYIYRGPDWQIGDEVVKAGDWLLGVIWEPTAWDQIKKGALTGFSIQGFAKRES